MASCERREISSLSTLTEADCLISFSGVTFFFGSFDFPFSAEFFSFIFELLSDLSFPRISFCGKIYSGSSVELFSLILRGVFSLEISGLIETSSFSFDFFGFCQLQFKSSLTSAAIRDIFSFFSALEDFSAFF